MNMRLVPDGRRVGVKNWRKLGVLGRLRANPEGVGIIAEYKPGGDVLILTRRLDRLDGWPRRVMDQDQVDRTFNIRTPEREIKTIECDHFLDL